MILSFSWPRSFILTEICSFCLRNLIQDDSERLNALLALLVNQGNQITFFKVLETHFKFKDDFIEFVAERIELIYLYHIFEILVLPTLLSLSDLILKFLELLIDDLLVLVLGLIELRLKLDLEVLVLLL